MKKVPRESEKFYSTAESKGMNSVKIFKEATEGSYKFGTDFHDEINQLQQ
jgi:hypothetical protein